jgi:hypothetical protein
VPNGTRRGRRLEDPADRDQLKGEPFLHQLDGGPDPFEQELRPEARDVRPIAALDIEHAGGHERADGLANGVAGRAEFSGELRLGRHSGARSEGARRDHRAHLRDRCFGERCGHGPSGE